MLKEQFKKYIPPNECIGSMIKDEFLNKNVLIKGWQSSSPISWPLSRTGMYRSFIFVKELVSLIRNESPLTVHTLTGVASETATRWRRKLKLPILYRDVKKTTPYVLRDPDGRIHRGDNLLKFCQKTFKQHAEKYRSGFYYLFSKTKIKESFLDWTPIIVNEHEWFSISLGSKTIARYEGRYHWKGKERLFNVNWISDDMKEFDGCTIETVSHQQIRIFQTSSTTKEKVIFEGSFKNFIEKPPQQLDAV